MPETSSGPHDLDALAVEAQNAIGAAKSLDALEPLRVQYLGRKSRLAEVLKSLGQLPADQRGPVGKRANEAKAAIVQQLAERRQALGAGGARPALDVTLPGSPVAQGRLHPVTQTLAAIVNVFVPMGFDVVQGPELEYEANNFDALNIPRDHPSREAFDTFFVDAPSPEPQNGRLLLRSHTSPVQVRLMEHRKPPLRIVVPGMVYRPDPLDPGHSFMFHQVEGLMLDAHTSFADLKGVLETFLKQLFGSKATARFRPHFFPFTEPSAEVDLRC